MPFYQKYENIYMSSSLIPSLSLPENVAAFLREKDASNDDFDEDELSFVLEHKLRESVELTEDQRKAGFAEVVALRLLLMDGQNRSCWETRFGPLHEGKLQNGLPCSIPDIKDIDAAVIEYWQKRATEANHPVLKSRYADILWDLTKAATGGKPSIEMARQAIDGYIECGKRFQNSDSADNRLERALEIALLIGDRSRAERVLATMFQLLDSTEHSSVRVIRLFDLMFDQKGVSLTPGQEIKLIGELENVLHGICDSMNPFVFVPKEPALRLARYYEKHGKKDDLKRVVCECCEALSKIAEKSQVFEAMHSYQEAYGMLVQFGFKEEAEKFQIEGKKMGEEAKRHMLVYSISEEIPWDKMEQYLDGITAGDMIATMTRIAETFLPRIEEMSMKLDETVEKAKLLSMIPIVKIGENQVIARAGSIESDRKGRMMLQMADIIKYNHIFLMKSLDRLREKYEFTSRTVIPILFRSPIFDPDRSFLLEQGIDAYLANDHVKAIHVLVPQIEHCLRRLLAMLGKPTNKHRRSDPSVMIEKSLNDILESEVDIKNSIGDDATFYLCVLLCDSRGFNLRNDLAHGLMTPERFDRFLSDRIMHILLLLGLLREIPGNS